MLAKPFIFFLTFVLTIANFVFLLLPMSIVGFPLYLAFKPFFQNAGYDLLMLFVAVMSGLTMFYMFVDMLFGFTARRLNRGTKRFEDMTAVPKHKEILRSFERLKSVFGMENVKLYLDPNADVVNAYAVGGVRKQSVTLTMGLIFEIHRKCANELQYVEAISGILGHELSHLSNKDFLPGLLAASSEAANRHVAKIVRWALMLFAGLFRIIPVIGSMLRNMIFRIYNLVMWFSSLFFRLVFSPVHSFVQKWFGRSIEYRCDRESARAVGGRAMVLALSSLGEGAYFSIFSTHPRTKSRINHVKDIYPVGGKIKAGKVNILTNFVSMLAVVSFICYISSELNWINLEKSYLEKVQAPVEQTTSSTKHKVMQLYYKYAK